MSKNALRFYQSLAALPWLAALVPLLMLTHRPLVILVLTAIEAHIFLALAFRRYTRRLHRQERGSVFEDRAREARELVDYVCARAQVSAPRHITITAKRLARYDSMADVLDVSTRLLDGAKIDPERAQAVVAHELGHRAQHLRPATYLCSLAKSYLLFAAPLCLVTSSSLAKFIVMAAISSALFSLAIPLERYGSRRIEADADVYTAALGYGPALARELGTYSGFPRTRLLRTHPSPTDRLRALESV